MAYGWRLPWGLGTTTAPLHSDNAGSQSIAFQNFDRFLHGELKNLMKRGTTELLYRVRFVAFLILVLLSIQTFAITSLSNFIDNELTSTCAPIRSSTSRCPNPHYLTPFIVSRVFLPDDLPY